MFIKYTMSIDTLCIAVYEKINLIIFMAQDSQTTSYMLIGVHWQSKFLTTNVTSDKS